MLRFLFDMTEENLVHIAVGGDLIAEVSADAELLDLGLQRLRTFFIVRDVIELDVLEAAAERAVQRLQEGTVQGLDRENDLAGGDVADHVLCGLDALNPQVGGDGVIVLLDGAHHKDEADDAQKRNPGAAEKLHNDDDDEGDASDNGAKTVDDGLELPAGAFFLHPVDQHAVLAEQEGDKHAAGVKREQKMLVAVKGEDQDGCGKEEQENAVGIVQASSAGNQLTGQEAVLRHQRHQQRHTGISGVGGKGENHNRHDLYDKVHGAALTEDRPGKLAHGGGFLIGPDLIEVYEGADPEEDQRDKASHGVQDHLGVLLSGIFEVRHAVGDRFHTGQRGTAGGKGTQQHKDQHLTGLLCDDSLFRRRIEAEGVADETRDNQRNHRQDEDIGGDAEHHGGLPQAAEISPGQQADDQESKNRLIAQECRKRRSDRRRTGAGTDRHGENIADDQRAAGHQTGRLAEVFMRDDIGAAALGVGVDGLAVAENENQQQTDDGGDNGQKIMIGQHPEHRDQNQKDLFPGIAHRGDCVTGEYGNAPEDVELLVSEFGIGKGSPDQDLLEFFLHGIRASH